MKPIAVVYVSETGHTEAYARMLGEKTGMSVYTLQQAETALAANAPVVYMSWLMAGRIKDYAKAARRYKLRGVCAVGLADSGSLDAAVRKNHRIPAETAVFSLQGGIERDKLQGVYASMIDTLIKALKLRKKPSDTERQMLALLQENGSRVNGAALAPVLQWYKNA